MKKQRKHYTPEEKVAILRRHLWEQVPISELCDKHGLQPTVFYRWQKEFFENGAAAFQAKARTNHSVCGQAAQLGLQSRPSSSIPQTGHLCDLSLGDPPLRKGLLQRQ
jgi:transposase-like protein